MLTALFAFLAELFGKWINKAPQIAPVAEQLGREEQHSADTEAAYDQLAKNADANAAANLEQLRHEPGTSDIDPDPAKDHPNLRYRD